MFCQGFAYSLGMRMLPLLATVIVTTTACASTARNDVNAASARPRSTTAPAAVLKATSSSSPASNRGGAPCGARVPPPERYRHIVVIMLENRRWPDVGGPGFAAMPYLHGLAQSCAYFPSWNETNPGQNSLTQYIGITSGVDNRSTVNDCSPSPSCRSLDDNIFRQVRVARGVPRSYVEGAVTGCSAAGNAVKHVPALYYFGGDDHSYCATEVRPLTELDADHLPTFAFITPNLCHDGHDCGNATVDSWLSVHLGALLRGADYRAGSTAVFVAYDEDRPVPNLVIAPTARRGPINLPGAGHSAALRTWDEMLGLPLLPPVRAAASLRESAHI